jgi:hypothetical protein
MAFIDAFLGKSLNGECAAIIAPSAFRIAPMRFQLTKFSLKATEYYVSVILAWVFKRNLRWFATDIHARNQAADDP